MTAYYEVHRGYREKGIHTRIKLQEIALITTINYHQFVQTNMLGLNSRIQTLMIIDKFAFRNHQKIKKGFPRRLILFYPSAIVQGIF